MQTNASSSTALPAGLRMSRHSPFCAALQALTHDIRICVGAAGGPSGTSQQWPLLWMRSMITASLSWDAMRPEEAEELVVYIPLGSTGWARPAAHQIPIHTCADC